MGFEERYEPLLARRILRDDVTIGRAYVIHARNGGVGVAVDEAGRIGYRLHREKFGQHYLFVEYDWDEGAPHGTAIPLAAIAAEPPHDEPALLTWLSDQAHEHRVQIDGAWEVRLGKRGRIRQASTVTDDCTFSAGTGGAGRAGGNAPGDGNDGGAGAAGTVEARRVCASGTSC